MTNQTELRIQQECFMHFHNTYPSQRGLLFKVKNEGTNKISGALDKASGLVPGVSDMIYLVPFNRPILLEFKTEKGRQSKNQTIWQHRVEAAGYEYHIIRTLQDFVSLIKRLNA